MIKPHPFHAVCTEWFWSRSRFNHEYYRHTKEEWASQFLFELMYSPHSNFDLIGTRFFPTTFFHSVEGDISQLPYYQFGTKERRQRMKYVTDYHVRIVERFHKRSLQNAITAINNNAKDNVGYEFCMHASEHQIHNALESKKRIDTLNNLVDWEFPEELFNKDDFKAHLVKNNAVDSHRSDTTINQFIALLKDSQPFVPQWMLELLILCCESFYECWTINDATMIRYSNKIKEIRKDIIFLKLQLKNC